MVSYKEHIIHYITANHTKIMTLWEEKERRKREKKKKQEKEKA